MKKLFALILALAMALSLAFSAYAVESSGEPEPEVPSFRCDMGEVVERRYHEDGDFMSILICTSDGNLWELQYYTATLMEPCFVVFDTMGTEEVTDDEITGLYIISEDLCPEQTTDFLGECEEVVS